MVCQRSDRRVEVEPTPATARRPPPRFAPLRSQEGALEWAFGELGTTDRARHLASLFIDDLADMIREGIDPRFELSRYGEKLAASAPTFDPLAEALADEPTFVDETLDAITRDWRELSSTWTGVAASAFDPPWDEWHWGAKTVTAILQECSDLC